MHLGPTSKLGYLSFNQNQIYDDTSYCFVSKTLPKRMPGICVTCCGWAMLSDNDVGVMTS